MKHLYILRGVSGSGKSKFAKLLEALFSAGSTSSVSIYEADDFFYDEYGCYNFDASKLHLAHKWCQHSVGSEMSKGHTVIVSNTTTTEKDLKPYLDLAEKYGYNVTCLIVENRHGNKDKHNVPEEILKKQEHNLRNSIKLR